MHILINRLLLRIYCTDYYDLPRHIYQTLRSKYMRAIKWCLYRRCRKLAATSPDRTLHYLYIEREI
jgi:hypothetical protein